MHFECLQSDFKNALVNVSRAVSTKVTIPALEGVLIEAQDERLTISGYDLEIAIITDIKATIQVEGAVAVKAKLLLDIIKKLPPKFITIDVEDNNLVNISCDNINYSIVGIAAQEFPEIPNFNVRKMISIQSDVLRDMLRQTVYAVSDNKSKPIYTGSLFEFKEGVFNIVAVDGYRMAIRSEYIDCKLDTSFVVPGKTQLEILKLLNKDDEKIEIVEGDRHIAFCVDNYRILSRLIEGIFMDYKSAIPKEHKTELIVNRRKLIDSVERMSLLCNDKIQNPVRCLFENDEIKLSTTAAIGKANEIMQADINGESVEMGLNCRYFLDALKNCDTDEVRILLSGSLSPMILKPVSGDSFLHIVVPMRLGNN